MLRILIVLAVLLVGGCSVPDGDDRATLEAAIRDSGALPSLIEKIVSDRQIRYLSTRPGNDKVSTVRCGDNDYHDILVGEVIGEMLASGSSFKQALDDLYESFEGDAQNAGHPPCTRIDDWRYVGDGAAEELSEEDAKRMTVSDVAEWIITSPLPPTGLAWGGPLGRLLPVLCGMSVQWGCPESPDYPGTLPTNPSPPTNGDAP